jgi:hypothetical protein
MAATAWEFYNNFKDQLGGGTVDLNGVTSSFNMILCGSTTNAADATLNSYASLTGELATDNGYTQAGKLLTVNWSVKTTTSTYSWTFNTVAFTAAATSAMTNVKYAVIMTVTSSILVCFSQLTTSALTVPAAKELIIEPNPVAFELN